MICVLDFKESFADLFRRSRPVGIERLHHPKDEASHSPTNVVRVFECPLPFHHDVFRERGPFTGKEMVCRGSKCEIVGPFPPSRPVAADLFSRCIPWRICHYGRRGVGSVRLICLLASTEIDESAFSVAVHNDV